MPPAYPHIEESAVHSQLAQAQRVAREKFNLDEAMAALPTESKRTPTILGTAGYRLRGQERADISDDLLREFATEILGAIRISAQYLDALRVVLGNQAHAERHGYIVGPAKFISRPRVTTT